VSALTVKNIDVQTINGIPVDDLMFLENGQLVVPTGNISFVDQVIVNEVIMTNDGRVNGIGLAGVCGKTRAKT
jgi:hypothetical protein